jgi:hypothetical protein
MLQCQYLTDLEDLQGLLLSRLIHVHGLEAPLKGGVTLNVLAVLIDGGGTHDLHTRSVRIDGKPWLLCQHAGCFRSSLVKNPGAKPDPECSSSSRTRLWLLHANVMS